MQKTLLTIVVSLLVLLGSFQVVAQPSDDELALLNGDMVTFTGYKYNKSNYKKYNKYYNYYKKKVKKKRWHKKKPPRGGFGSCGRHCASPC
jgi:hypothetical protein